MAVNIEAVQAGIWQEGMHELLGYATDYAFGDQRGLQRLVLKGTGLLTFGCSGRPSWETTTVIVSAFRTPSRARSSN